VFAVSEQVRQYCIEVDGLSPDKVETLYNGLDLAGWGRLHSADSVSGEAVIKTVGNIRRVKGHDIFVRAAAQIAKEYPGARFSIGGAVLEAEFYAELQQMVQELGLEGRFSFDGSVSDLQTYLADADVFILPSRSEGFSNAIVEAMAAGLPVIATDVGGNAEAVQDGVTGTIVPPEDVNAMAAAMRAMLADPERARVMGEAGKARVAERFTTEAMMRQLVTAYRRILGRDR
jgi:glycosyltransferase involved in cell wall biosynthesis